MQEMDPGGGHGNPLQYSCLENPMDRGAWKATVHRITQSQTQLMQLSTQAYIFLLPIFWYLPSLPRLNSWSVSELSSKDDQWRGNYWESLICKIILFFTSWACIWKLFKLILRMIVYVMIDISSYASHNVKILWET